MIQNIFLNNLVFIYPITTNTKDKQKKVDSKIIFWTFISFRNDVIQILHFTLLYVYFTLRFTET